MFAYCNEIRSPFAFGDGITLPDQPFAQPLFEHKTVVRIAKELNKFLYCCVNLVMIAIGAALSRRVFAVFGGLGVSFYLGHLSHTIFRDSMLFPVALTAIGLAVIAAGVYWQRHETTLGERLRSFLPARVRELLAHRAE